MRLPTRKRGRIALGIGGTLVLVIGIAAAIGALSGESSSSPQADPVAPARPKSGLTGFGATDAAWDARHREDTRFASGAAYDPDPSLARGGDQRYTDRYYGVIHNGNVLSYEMRFPSRTGIQSAKRSLLASEFPSDAKVVWFKQKKTCAQMLVRSKKVNRELGARVVALVEFSSAADDRYDSSEVSYAIVIGIDRAGPGSIAC